MFQHFGHTEQFKIYTVKNGKIVSSKIVDTNGNCHGALAGFLAEQNVYALICGGIVGGSHNCSMAGSTAGGIKLSRIVIAMKGAYINLRKLINPRYVPKAKFEGKLLEEKTINDVFAFVTLYFFLLVAATFLLSFDSVNGTVIQIVSDAGSYEVEHGFFSNFSAVLACISNVGPAFEAIGPYASFAEYSGFSKIILILTMMLGRLEILPVFILFSPKTWKRV